MVFFILLSVAGALPSSGTPFFGWAVANAVLSICSNGVMANFRRDQANVPAWAVAVAVLTTIAAVGFAIAGLAA